MVTAQLDAVIGADTHRDTHSAALLGPTGAVSVTTTVPTSGGGYQALLDFALQHTPGPRLLWAVEGTRSYGIGLTRFLHTMGSWCRGRPPAPAGPPPRQVRHPRRIGAAREALARTHQAIPRNDGDREAYGCCWSPARAPSPAAPPPSTASRR